MKLINTLKINPYKYSNKNYLNPNANRLDSPKEWNQFGIRRISDKDLGNLKGIKSGSYLVDITTIEDKELGIILQEILKNVDLVDVNVEDLEDQIIELDGGIVLKDKNEIIIEPTCCGDIGNLQKWEMVLEGLNENWKMLWIGHPWVYFRKRKEQIEFSEYTQANIEDIENIKILFQVSEIELKSEIRRMRMLHIKFENRIQSILQKMDVKYADKIAKLMTGNE